MNYSSKPNIKLEDYKFELDLKKRLLLSKINNDEYCLLKEIIYNSLSIPLDDIQNCTANFNHSLENLKAFDLFEVKGQKLLVNKETRKYLEVQIERFDEDFCADHDFFLQLIHPIPKEILPDWYPISKVANDLFDCITENCFKTPEIYSKYIINVQSENESIKKIIDLLFESEDLLLKIDSLLSILNISREELEKHIMILEFHKICCLQYILINDTFEQILIPFSEWKNYLLNTKQAKISSINIENEITVRHPHDFGFIKDLDETLKACLDTPLNIEIVNNHYSFTEERIISKIACSNYKNKLCTFHEIISKLIELKLVTIENNLLIPQENFNVWLSKTMQEKGMTLYFTTIYSIRKGVPGEFSDKDIREIEKSLKKIISKGWVYLDEFIKAMLAPIGGEIDKNILQKKNRKWNYFIPVYTQKEKSFITKMMEKHLFHSGLIRLGLHNKKKCISLTPFGKLSLGD